MEDYIYDYYEGYDDIFRKIMLDMVNKSTKKHLLTKINPNMYQKALNDFMKFGEITHYPVKYIYAWKEIVIKNFTYLDVITMLYGHKNGFDIDEFNDLVLNSYETGNQVNSWNEAMTYIEENGYDEILDNILPKFSNGQDLISDYGLEPLAKIIKQLYQTNDPNEIIVLINKALDISHQRSDLSELFIEGGEASLNRISGVNEGVVKIIKEEVLNFLNNLHEHY